MAVTNERMMLFAKNILNDEAKDVVIDRITMKLMRSFQRGSPEIREEAVKALDSIDFFFKELQYIIDSEANLQE